jgi:hypothetical protein
MNLADSPISVRTARLRKDTQLAEGRGKYGQGDRSGSGKMLWLHRTCTGQSRRRARYALASAIRGGGRQIVDAVVSASPDERFLAVPTDWSGGFWKRMA